MLLLSFIHVDIWFNNRTKSLHLSPLLVIYCRSALVDTHTVTYTVRQVYILDRPLYVLAYTLMHTFLKIIHNSLFPPITYKNTAMGMKWVWNRCIVVALCICYLNSSLFLDWEARSEECMIMSLEEAKWRCHYHMVCIIVGTILTQYMNIINTICDIGNHFVIQYFLLNW